MAKSKSTVVGPKVVRMWARENEQTVRSLKDSNGKPVNVASIFGGPQGRGRGRVSPAVVQAFLDANAGTAYAEKSETPTIEVPKFDRKDRRTGRTAAISLPEFRALSGQAKGRPSAASIEAAGRALSAANRK